MTAKCQLFITITAHEDLHPGRLFVSSFTQNTKHSWNYQILLVNLNNIDALYIIIIDSITTKRYSIELIRQIS